jgi:hypothetical protein
MLKCYYKSTEIELMVACFQDRERNAHNRLSVIKIKNKNKRINKDKNQNVTNDLLIASSIQYYKS